MKKKHSGSLEKDLMQEQSNDMLQYRWKTREYIRGKQNWHLRFCSVLCYDILECKQKNSHLWRIHQMPVQMGIKDNNVFQLALWSLLLAGKQQVLYRRRRG